MGAYDSSSHNKLEHALLRAHEEYERNNPVSQNSYEIACKYLPGGNTRTVLHTTPFPLTIQSGRGPILKTVDGHEYVDFLGEYTAGIYGHNNSVIRAAIDRALDNGWNYGGQNAMEAQLAQIVCQRFPAMEKVRFVNSGTEANMIALGTALVHTGKKKILVFTKGYHGSTISGRAASTKPSLNLPHDFVVAPYNDVKATRAIITGLPENSLAAILVEPMLGSGGCYAGTQEFLSLLRAEATRLNTLLIFDEIMTSRLSYHGYGHSLGIKPDMITVGKWVGGGMSFGAFGGREDIMKIFDPRLGQLEHAGTFNNNILSMSAGVAGCTLLNADRLDELNGLGDDMRFRSETILAKFDIRGEVPMAPILDEAYSTSTITQNGAPEGTAGPAVSSGPAASPPRMFVKGVSSLMSIQFSGARKDMLQGVFYHHMLQQGVYMAQRGFIALSIEITPEHVDLFLGALSDFCEKWQEHLHSD